MAGHPSGQAGPIRAGDVLHFRVRLDGQAGRARVAVATTPHDALSSVGCEDAARTPAKPAALFQVCDFGKLAGTKDVDVAVTVPQEAEEIGITAVSHMRAPGGVQWIRRMADVRLYIDQKGTGTLFSTDVEVSGSSQVRPAQGSGGDRPASAAGAPGEASGAVVAPRSEQVRPDGATSGMKAPGADGAASAQTPAHDRAQGSAPGKDALLPVAHSRSGDDTDDTDDSDSTGVLTGTHPFGTTTDDDTDDDDTLGIGTIGTGIGTGIGTTDTDGTPVVATTNGNGVTDTLGTGDTANGNASAAADELGKASTKPAAVPQGHGAPAATGPKAPAAGGQEAPAGPKAPGAGGQTAPAGPKVPAVTGTGAGGPAEGGAAPNAASSKVKGGQEPEAVGKPFSAGRSVPDFMRRLSAGQPISDTLREISGGRPASGLVRASFRPALVSPRAVARGERHLPGRVTASPVIPHPAPGIPAHPTRGSHPRGADVPMPMPVQPPVQIPQAASLMDVGLQMPAAMPPATPAPALEPGHDPGSGSGHGPSPLLAPGAGPMAAPGQVQAAPSFQGQGAVTGQGEAQGQGAAGGSQAAGAGQAEASQPGAAVATVPQGASVGAPLPQDIRPARHDLMADGERDELQMVRGLPAAGAAVAVLLSALWLQMKLRRRRASRKSDDSKELCR
ncbi:hypothetical protein [Sphaerisporangium perillae]|uniref:hypothetical protein n=1 Tax=Sphaerisporangium perillae TaxID=2935860 RepID=UPI00200D0AE6|nr:hypothetical protein [Sphaerisporangium perillae]